MSRYLLPLGLVLFSQSVFAMSSAGRLATCSLTRAPRDYANDKMIETTEVGFVDGIADDPLNLLTEDGRYTVVVDSMNTAASETTHRMETKISVRVFYKKRFLISTYANAESDGNVEVIAHVPDPEKTDVTRAQLPVLLKLFCKIELKK